MTFWKWFRRIMIVGFGILFILVALLTCQQGKDSTDPEVKTPSNSSNTGRNNTFNLKQKGE